MTIRSIISLLALVLACASANAQTLTALTTTSPIAIAVDGHGNQLIFSGIPNPLFLPNGIVVFGIPSVPWPSQDGQFKLVQVALFSAPNGQIAIGTPNYTIDGQGNVSQIFATTSAVPSTALAMYSSALNAGIAITSSGTPALNATYAIDPVTMQMLYDLSIYISVNGVYPGGAATLNWPDASGAVHVFGLITTFKAFAKALQDYVAKLVVAEAAQAAGGTPTWPAAASSIP
jgi:hypothetical protein